MTKLNCVVIGAGNIGDVHASAYKNNEHCKLVSVCDINEKQAEKLADVHNLENYHNNIDNLFNSYDIDITSVTTPPMAHFEPAAKAMKNGSNCLVEKPITTTLEETKQLKQIQEKNRVLLSVMHNQKFLREYKKALSWIDSGQIGEVTNVYISEALKSKVYEPVKDPNHWSHQIQGGPFAEHLPHPIYLLFQMVGKLDLERVITTPTTDKRPWMPANRATISLSNQQANVCIDLSVIDNEKANSNTEENKIEHYLIQGTDGQIYIRDGNAVRVPSGNRLPRALEVNKNALLSNLELAKAIYDLIRSKIDSNYSFYTSGHEVMIDRFVDQVLGISEPPVTWKELYTTMDLTCKIGEKIENRS